MFARFLGTAVICTLLIAVGASASSARSETTHPESAIPVSVPPPIGLLLFCDREPHACRSTRDPVVFAQDLDAARRQYWRTVLSDQSRPPGAAVRADPVRTMGISVPRTEPQRFLAVDSPSSVPRPSDLWTAVDRINRSINRRIRHRPDQTQYGLPDHWAFPPMQEGWLVGDCEDAVLAKRAALIAAGVPSDSLSIALGVTPWGEQHAVLLVAGPDADYVLDSLNDDLLPSFESRVVLSSRQTPGDLLNWLGLKDH